MFYEWVALPHDTGALPVALGFTDDLGRAQAHAGAAVRDGRAFLASIRVVVPVMMFTGLSVRYRPAGLFCLGRRTTSGDVRWDWCDAPSAAAVEFPAS